MIQLFHNSEHRCMLVDHQKVEETDNCGNFINWFIDGYELNMTAGAFALKSPAEIQIELLKFATDAANSPNCIFFL